MADAIRAARHDRGWSVAEAARRLRQLSTEPLPGVESIARSWKRWEAGTDPFPRYRVLLAQLLGLDQRGLPPDVVAIYPRRSAVPLGLWQRLVDEVSERVDVLVFVGLFLPEQHSDLVERLGRLAANGGQVRLLLGNPDSDAVLRRSREEGIGDSIAAKVHNVLAHYRPLAETRTGAQVRLHQTTLYASIYRFDEEMLVNPHVYGLPGAQGPTLHLTSGDLFATYEQSFERVWDSATEWPGPTT